MSALPNQVVSTTSSVQASIISFGTDEVIVNSEYPSEANQAKIIGQFNCLVYSLQRKQAKLFGIEIHGQIATNTKNVAKINIYVSDKSF